MPQPHSLVPHAQRPDTVSPFGIKASQRPGGHQPQANTPISRQQKSRCPEVHPSRALSEPARGWGAGGEGHHVGQLCALPQNPLLRLHQERTNWEGGVSQVLAGMGLCTDLPHPRAPRTPVGSVSGVWDSQGPRRSPCGLALEGKCSEALGPARRRSSQGHRL